MNEPVVHSSKGCVDRPSEATRIFELDRRLLVPFPSCYVTKFSTDRCCATNIFFLRRGDFCNSCSVALCKCAPYRLVEECQISWRSMPIWRSESFPPHLGGCGLKGLVGSFYWGLSLTSPVDHRGLPRFPRQLDHVLPPFVTSLLRSARTSASTSRTFTRPLSPSVLLVCSCFHPSLAGRWFGFAVPTLSLSGASVVAEENRYPFYVFIISQIKKRRTKLSFSLAPFFQ